MRTSCDRISYARLVTKGLYWGVETGELTPTMKMKRKVIEKKFSDIFEKMYE